MTEEENACSKALITSEWTAVFTLSLYHDLSLISKRTDPQAVQREASLAHNPPGLDHISFLVEDVNQSYTECQAKGISFLGEPQDQDWGARIVAFKDPDGNNLYFLQYL